MESFVCVVAHAQIFTCTNLFDGRPVNEQQNKQELTQLSVTGSPTDTLREKHTRTHAFVCLCHQPLYIKLDQTRDCAHFSSQSYQSDREN